MKKKIRFWVVVVLFFSYSFREVLNDHSLSVVGYRLEVNVVGAKEVVTQLIIRYGFQLFSRAHRQTESAGQSVTRLVFPIVSHFIGQTASQSIKVDW